MSAPDDRAQDRAQIVGFRDRLAEAQRAALARGEMSRRDYDALLMDADFEDEAFETFRARLVAAGVQLPEDDVEVPSLTFEARQIGRASCRERV